MEKLIKNRLYLVIIAAFALAMIWFVTLYNPNQAKLRSATQEFSLLEQDINESRNQISSAGSVAKKIEQVDSQLNKYLQGMSTLDSIPEFIAKLNIQLAEYGIEDAEIIPKLPDLLNNDNIALGRGKLNKVEFNISGHARYLNLGRFIESLEEEVFYAGCTNLDISQNQSANTDIAFDFKFMAYLKGQG